jgi:hypothetical protein
MATLVIKDDTDIIEKSESNGVLTFVLTDEKFAETEQYKDKTGFTLLNYICDTMMPEFVIGVNRIRECIVFDINENKNKLSIQGRGDKDYFNMGNKAEMRKITIASVLGEDLE